jgi:D-3-phosphoglycerate dehydrogenase / 2-oxoglutarate reductase
MTQPTILIAESSFAPAARAILAEAGPVLDFESHERFVEQLPEADAVVAGLEVHFDAGLLGRAARLRTIATRTSQLRHVDLDEAKRREIAIIFIRPDDPVLQETSSTAEEAFALLLALARNVPWAFDSVKRGEWERTRFGGSELRGKTLGVVGFGRLGRMVAGYAQAFGMRVVAHDPHVAIEAEAVEPVSLDALLLRSDIVSIHCTYSPETAGLIGCDEFAAMRKGALFVNTARGEITDEAALLAALNSGHLGGAAVDTLGGEQPDGAHLQGHPLVEYARNHENLIVLPHLGGATVEATERTQVHIAQLLVEHLRASA